MERKRERPTRLSAWRERLHEIIFEADTFAGKLFDVLLLIAIFLSVLVVVLDSVKQYRDLYARPLYIAEWFFTILFTIEYVLRLVCTRRPIKYALSFYGVVDLLAVVPTYVMLLELEKAHPLFVIRALRLLRIFRIFKLAHFLREAAALRRAIVASRAKIAVFLVTVLVAVTIMGAAMHLVEGEASGFTSIPESMYWAIVTMTTVGYGDIAPGSPLGKTLAALMMILGYSLIIVPTGIISAELVHASGKPVTTQVCPDCTSEGHDRDAVYCKFCGGKL